MEYIVGSKGVNDRRMFPINVNLQSKVTDRDHDWYKSLFIYNEEHKKWFDDNGNSVKGITDVTTDILLWDFDSKVNIEQARTDALELCSRLHSHNIDLDNIRVFFSGNKGFHVELGIDKRLTQPEFKSITYNLANDLVSYDTAINDANRLIRLEFTRHKTSGLFKIPISVAELQDLTVEDVKKRAFSVTEQMVTEYYDSIQSCTLPTSLYLLKDTFKKREVTHGHVNMQDISELSFKDKMKGLTNCKWAILNGFYDDGQRNYALMALCATLRAQKTPVEVAYNMLKAADRQRVQRTNGEAFPKEEIWNNIVQHVYSEGWNGGQYTCKEPGKLQDICLTLGEHCCSKAKVEENDVYKPITLVDIKDNFKHYVKNIDKNTIVTGLPSLDRNVFMSTGSNIGIIGAASSGKSSLALNILNNTSKAGVKSIFASLDMSSNRMFEKVMYKISGLQRKELYKQFYDDKEEILIQKLKEEFGNVNFFNKSSPTVRDVRDYIIRCQDESGEKIKLVMLDYFERVSSDFSDDTAASKKVAGELQDLVNDLDICLITLVQPNKFALNGGANSAIYDYTKIKGSSFVYQAFRQIISIWRPFYHPKEFADDHFMQMAILKNDLGELNEFVMGWNGQKGLITELTDEEMLDFEDRIRKRDEKLVKQKISDGW